MAGQGGTLPLDLRDLDIQSSRLSTVKGTDHRHLRKAGGRQGVGASAKTSVSHVPLIINVGEESPHRVEVAGGERIVLVVMALAAAECGPQPDLRHVANAICLIDRPILVDLDATLMRGLQQPVIGRSEHQVVWMLALSRLDQIAGQLQQREAVEGQILQKGMDHPVAIGRGVVGLVTVVADGVCVANKIEPPAGQSLSMPWRGQQGLDHPLKRRG